METLGYIFLVWLAIPIVGIIVYNAFKYWTCWWNGLCYECNGKGGWHNPLLIFSRDSWERCRKCNGTGKRK